MHTLNIPSTKAARDRLLLLKTPEALPLPLDHTRLSPFDIRFQGDTLCVTFEGRDIACVAGDMNDDKKSFPVRVLTGPSDTVDHAITRLFGTLNAHMDQVGRILAAERRAQKAEQDARSEELRLQQEAERPRKMAQKEHVARGMFGPDEGSEPPLTRAEVEMAARTSDAREDTIRVGGMGRHFSVSPMGGGFSVNLQMRDDTEVNIRISGGIWDQDIKGWGFSEASPISTAFLRRSVRNIAAKNADVLVPETVLDIIRRLPDAPFRVEALAVSLPNVPAAERGVVERTDLDDGWALSIHPRSLDIYHGWRHVLGVSMTPGNPNIGFGKDIRDVVVVAGPLAAEMRPLLTETDLHRIGAYWIGRVAAHAPDADMTAFLPLDEEALTAQAERSDAGYGF